MPAARTHGILTAALALSAPALGYAAVGLFFAATIGGLAWTGLLLLLFLALAAAISIRLLFRPAAATAETSETHVESLVLLRPPPVWTQILHTAGAGAFQFCYWVIPALWIYFVLRLCAYIIGQCFPQNYDDHGITIACSMLAVMLAFALSYIPSRGPVVLVVSATLSAIALAATVVFAILFSRALAARHPSVNTPDWTMDSTGAPTQFVQDTMPDPAPIVPDSTATVPKVDSKGNPIWVYHAVDAAGQPVVDAAGHAVLVPTDAEGKATTLPRGAASVQPEEFHMPNAADTGGGDDKFRPHFLDDIPQEIPLSQRCATALLSMAALAFGAFQLIASFGRAGRPDMSRARSILILALAILPSVAVCMAQYLIGAAQNAVHNSYVISNSSAPIGDVMQIVGFWAFGSARAGWWFMLSQAIFSLLILLTSAWLCLTLPNPRRSFDCDTPETIPHNGPDSGRTHLGILLRAAVAATLCVLCLWGQNVNQWVSAVVSPFYHEAASILPDLASVLLFSATVMVLFLCSLCCLSSLAAAKANGLGASAKIIPILGLLGGFAAIAYHVALLFLVTGNTGKTAPESIGALLVSGGWAIGVTMLWLLRRSRQKRGIITT